MWLLKQPASSGTSDAKKSHLEQTSSPAPLLLVIQEARDDHTFLFLPPPLCFESSKHGDGVCDDESNETNLSKWPMTSNPYILIDLIHSLIHKKEWMNEWMNVYQSPPQKSHHKISLLPSGQKRRKSLTIITQPLNWISRIPFPIWYKA